MIDAVVPADADAVLALLEIEAWASSMFVPIPGDAGGRRRDPLRTLLVLAPGMNTQRANSSDHGVMMIDTTFDLRTDAAGKDPDTYSPTLRRYHQLLWSKPLPRWRCVRTGADQPSPVLLQPYLGEG